MKLAAPLLSATLALLSPAMALAQGYGLNNGQIQKVFPGFQPSYNNIASLIRS